MFYPHMVSLSYLSTSPEIVSRSHIILCVRPGFVGSFLGVFPLC